MSRNPKKTAPSRIDMQNVIVTAVLMFRSASVDFWIS
jgi:hypothetical protein